MGQGCQNPAFPLHPRQCEHCAGRRCTQIFIHLSRYFSGMSSRVQGTQLSPILALLIHWTYLATFLKRKNTEPKKKQKDTAHKRHKRNSNPKETIMMKEAQKEGNG